MCSMDQDHPTSSPWGTASSWLHVGMSCSSTLCHGVCPWVYRVPKHALQQCQSADANYLCQALHVSGLWIVIVKSINTSEIPALFCRVHSWSILRWWRLLRALAYIHSILGVCHQDLEPQNVLVRIGIQLLSHIVFDRSLSSLNWFSIACKSTINHVFVYIPKLFPPQATSLQNYCRPFPAIRAGWLPTVPTTGLEKKDIPCRCKTTAVHSLLYMQDYCPFLPPA